MVALRARGIDAVAVNPGAVASDIWRYLPNVSVIRAGHALMMAILFLDVDQGAAPSVQAAAVSPTPQPLYLTPYRTVARVQPLLEVFGPFAGAQPARCRAEREAAGHPERAREAAERLWQWTEAAIRSARK